MFCRTKVAGLLLVIPIVLAGCSKAKYNPYRIDEGMFHDTVKKIAVAPMRIQVELGETEAVEERFEMEITRQLQDMGYAIVPCDKYGEIWEKKSESVGGYFDPVTGMPDEEKFKMVSSLVFDELQDYHQIDAVLLPVIRERAAGFGGGQAEWDGVRVSITGGGFMKNFLTGAGTYEGRCPALSLVVFVEDEDGNTLYASAGGIELLVQFEGLVSGNFVDRDKNELLRDDEKNMNAVRLALGRLAPAPVTE